MESMEDATVPGVTRRLCRRVAFRHRRGGSEVEASEQVVGRCSLASASDSPRQVTPGQEHPNACSLYDLHAFTIFT